MSTATVQTALADAMDAIWREETVGYSEHQLAHSLAEHTRDLAALEAGSITPRSIIGTGYREPKKIARRWLTERIEQCRLDLSTRGWSNGINRGNAAGRVRDGETGNPAHGWCTCESWRDHGVPHDPDAEARYREQFDYEHGRLVERS